MSVSAERLAYVRELFNDERVDVTDTSSFTDADGERFFVRALPQAMYAPVKPSS